METVGSSEEARAQRAPRTRVAALLLPALLLCPGPASGQGTVDPDHGFVALGRLLRGLGSAKRVLVIGAHPDDEDTSLLTWVERGLGGDAAYLSLNRGEGGQNLIGPELGEGLGLLRTGELLAARRLDGAEQYFTRAYDFGYSKSADETFALWPEDSLLADVVAVVRRFRPHVIVSTFSGTRRDGHGQHQAAGILAGEVFDVAADPRRFADQIEAGLRPWSPSKLYRSTRFDREATTLSIATGVLDPLYGRSYHQIAMASRSQHRSQDMGRIESLGPNTTSLQLMRSRVSASSLSDDKALFAGIDTTLVGLLVGVSDVRAAGPLERAINDYLVQLELARSSLSGWDAGSLVQPLASGLSRLRRAIELAEEAGAEADELRFTLSREERELQAALREAAGVITDVFVDDDMVVPGQAVEVEVQIWNGGREAVEVERVVLHTAAGQMESARGSVSPGNLTRRRFQVTIPKNAEYTRPYFLREARSGAVYRWPPLGAERGKAFGRPEIEAEIDVMIGGIVVRQSVEAVHRFADQARGEVRRPFHIVPAVGVGLQPTTSVWPLGRRGGLGFRATLRSESPTAIRGRLSLDIPPGWKVTPTDTVFDLRAPGATTTVEFRVEAPEALAAASYAFSARVVTAGGGQYNEGYTIIDYPHVWRSLLYSPAAARVEAFDLSVDESLRIGFVPGAGDATAEALRAMGLQVEVLDEQAISTADLSRYDVLVLGIRAYETNTALAAGNRRILDWVRAGGTLISQYQQYAFFRGDYAPYRLAARFPHDRVSDETAPVRILAPEHPAFNRPNRIAASDFEGWVQERGLYFANDWDERFRPLLETADPGEEPKQGSLLVATVGDGIYVYTGLSFFRQLPAGVPGAYRLLANLLSLKG